MLKTETYKIGNIPVKSVCYIESDSEQKIVRKQLEEEYIVSEEDSNIDALLSKTSVPDDTADDIESLAHLCREDYLYNVQKNTPDEFLKGVVGMDEHLSEMIIKEQSYASD